MKTIAVIGLGKFGFYVANKTKKDELIIIAKALFICFCSIVLLKIFGC